MGSGLRRLDINDDLLRLDQRLDDLVAAVFALRCFDGPVDKREELGIVLLCHRLATFLIVPKRANDPGSLYMSHVL